MIVIYFREYFHLFKKKMHTKSPRIFDIGIHSRIVWQVTFIDSLRLLRGSRGSDIVFISYSPLQLRFFPLVILLYVDVYDV